MEMFIQLGVVSLCNIAVIIILFLQYVKLRKSNGKYDSGAGELVLLLIAVAASTFLFAMNVNAILSHTNDQQQFVEGLDDQIAISKEYGNDFKHVS